MTPGEQIGLCGRTGNWSCAHAHTELTYARPSSWYQWPYGWARFQVEAVYQNPYTWWQAATALVLADGGQPIPPETVKMLEDWQLAGWVMAQLWQWAGIPFNPEAGTTKAWIKFLREGTYLGRPRTEERPYGEGDEAGVWVEHDYGCLFYRTRDGQSSITG